MKQNSAQTEIRQKLSSLLGASSAQGNKDKTNLVFGQGSLMHAPVPGISTASADAGRLVGVGVTPFIRSPSRPSGWPPVCGRESRSVNSLGRETRLTEVMIKVIIKTPFRIDVWC
jgi:hypothetical protein